MTITDFSALTMRLPLLDPATLSQAWRDALHQAALHTAGKRAGISRPGTDASPHVRDLQVSRNGACGRLINPRQQPAPAKVMRMSICGQERTLFRTCTQKLAVHTHAATRAVLREKHVITLPHGERICLLVTPVGQNTHVTVLCAPHLQQDMRRALAVLARSLAHASIALNVSAFAKVA